MKNRLIVILILILAACNPSRKMIQEGNRLEQEGKHEDAANYYYNALLNNPGDKEAKEGLKKSAQPVLNGKFTEFSKLVVENKIADAVKQYKNAEKYAKNAESVGVMLDWPNEYNEVYLDVRDEYVLGLYDEALMLLRDKKFDAAEKQFGIISEYDSSFKEATILRLNTVLEPLYQRGLNQLAKGQYKEAYTSFDRILDIDDHYKDAQEQRDLAKEKATISLAVFPVVNQSVSPGDEAALNILIPEKLARHQDKYIRISEGAPFQRNIEARGWGLLTDPRKAAEAGRNLGYRYVLITQLVRSEETVTPFTKVTRDAYEAFTENIRNPITGTYNYISKFRKTTYEDTYESRRLRVKVAYQLVSSADGRVLYSDEIEQEKADELHLLSYDGNINNLYPELPVGNYLPPPNDAWREQFTLVKRNLLTKEELSKELSIQIAEIISGAILPRLR